MVHVVRGEHRLGLDVFDAVGGLQYQRDVFADILQLGQPGCLHRSGRDQCPFPREDVSLVERRLSVRPRWISDVAERFSTGKDRGLPGVTPESGQLAHALAPDPQSASGEVLRHSVHRHRAPSPEQLLVARAAHHVAFVGRRQPLPRIALQRALNPRRHHHLRLDVKCQVHPRTAGAPRGQISGRGLDGLTVVGHGPGVEGFDTPEDQSSRTQYGGLTVRTGGRQGWAPAAEPVHPPAGESDVDLLLVVVPVRRHRLDTDPRQAEQAAIVDRPEAHGVPHFGVFRPIGEDEFPGGIDAAGEVCHDCPVAEVCAVHWAARSE